MKDFMKRFSPGSLICCAAGVLLLVNPHIITDLLNTVIGVVLIALGVLWAAGLLMNKQPEQPLSEIILPLLGSIALTVGGFYVLRHMGLLERVLMLALGIYLLCSALPKLIESLRTKKSGGSGWEKSAVTSAATVILGVVAIAIPAFLPAFVMKTLGVLLILGGIGNFISGLSSSKLFRDMKLDYEYRKGKPAPNTSGKVIDIENYRD